MQTNENHPNRKRIRSFFREKGYYIVLALCVCAVGVSGWLFVSGAIAEKKALRQETMSIATSAEEPAKNPSAEQKPAPTAAAEEETAPAAAMTDESVREAAKNVRVWPVSGSTQAAYSVDALQYNATTQDWRTHAGVDLAASVGTPVKAAGSGVVTAVYDDEFLGTTVVINHPDGHVSQYSNLAVMPSVSAGDSVEAGQTIGILGGTGSAKSSLVNLISRLYDVSEGSVRVGGHDVREYDLTTLRDEVAVVLQKNVLFSGTILENLRWGNAEATQEECERVCRLACADDFIQAMPQGYETYIEQGGTNVSGGQKQRLCIARALLKKPKILILDDSTSAVDTATDARIRKALREEIPNTTKIIIAQRISSVQDADRILVLDEGRVNGFGTHEQLLAANRIYQEVYQGQTQGGGDFDEKEGA